jgi:hypothetical protein
LGLSCACCEHRQQDAGRAKAGEARHDVVSPNLLSASQGAELKRTIVRTVD